MTSAGKFLRRFAVVTLICIAVIPAATEPQGARDGNAANVILLTLDTTRADHLGAYGYRKGRTPSLDRLAAEGARFESAFSSLPNTLPSHTVILTGQYPFRTGVRDNLVSRLPDSAVTLAEILKNHGYETLAFVSAAVLDRTFGLNQGFDVYDDRVQSPAGALLYDERNAAAVNQSAFGQLARIHNPYFLWVHYYDPHVPYEAPAPFGKDPALAPYDAEIAFMDQQIGQLLQKLGAAKLLENTLVVVVADHGESLGEHGEKTHGVFLYDSVMRVPLMLWFPKRIPPRTVIAGMARTVDILPTILDYLGVPEVQTDGISLRKSVTIGRSDVAALYEETFLPQNHFGWSPLFGLRTPEWHFILAPRKEIYNLKSDPSENSNVLNQNPAAAKDLEKKLREYPFAEEGAATPEVSEELKEKIASLGYLSSTRNTQTSAGMDPKDGISLLDKIDHAGDYVAQGRTKEAITDLDSVLQRNPQNVPARVTLGRIYMDQRNYDEAARQFRAALEYSTVDSIHLDLALALVGLGHYREAADQYRQALSLNSRQLRAYVNWAELELRQKNIANAADILQHAEDADVHAVELTLLRGRLAAYRGKMDDAINFFQEALREDPEDPVAALYFLGSAYLQTGKTEDAIQSFKNLLQKEPNHPGALRYLGDIYFQNKDAAAAKEYYERLLRLDPQLPDAPLLRERLRSLSQ